MAAKAVSLLSGGLDSILATKLILEQGVEVVGLNFVTLFCTCTSKSSSCRASVSAARELGIPLKSINSSAEFLKIVENPKHGYGSNMNPCIDCRIFMFKKAAEYMKECGASFVVTGEVLGERPMSQRLNAIHLIEKESGLKGFIVRPLSAKLFEPSIPEQRGWVDRERFLGIEGRSRKPQIELARNLGINDYPCPAGGCLLTDPGFAARIKDLVAHDTLTVSNVGLLKVGRHFRLNRAAKAVVGRDRNENEALMKKAQDGDTLFQAKSVPGPFALLRGQADEDSITTTARLAARYSDTNGNLSTGIEYRQYMADAKMLLKAEPLEEDKIDKLRI